LSDVQKVAEAFSKQPNVTIVLKNAAEVTK
jgi:hypothetical protein